MRVVGEFGTWEEKEVKDEHAGQNEGSLDFVKHSDAKEEEVTEEKEGRGEGTSFGDEEHDHRGEYGDVQRDGTLAEPGGAVPFEPVGAEIEEDEDGDELESKGFER